MAAFTTSGGTAVPARYNSSVLLGNWAEDRTGLPPAPGGIPDLGFREYTPNYRRDFRAPTDSERRELTFPRHRVRYGMMTADSWNEAAYSIGAGPEALLRSLRGGHKPFDTTHGGVDMSKQEIAATFHTTARDAMAQGVKVSAEAMSQAAKTNKTVAASSFATAAGGAGSVVHDRGKKTRGVAGEMLRRSDDARYDTLAQRSWLGHPDAGLLASTAPPPPRGEVDWMSPKLGGEGATSIADTVKLAGPGATHGRFAAFQAAARHATDVTAAAHPLDASRRPGRRVFVDDP